MWVFRLDGRLLIQRRSAAKKIGPSQWDLSVAEHLQPGESFLEVGGAGLCAGFAPPCPLSGWLQRMARGLGRRSQAPLPQRTPTSLLPDSPTSAPHVNPTGARLQGAARGLAEELGIEVPASELAGPLAPTHRRELHAGEFHDVELVQSYRWAGPPPSACATARRLLAGGMAHRSGCRRARPSRLVCVVGTKAACRLLRHQWQRQDACLRLS